MLPQLPVTKKTMNHRALDFKKAAPHCGAEVCGIQLAQSLEESTVHALESAVAEHGVLFFRNQAMTVEEQKRLGRYFGELHVHPAWPRLVEGHPEVMEIYTDENSRYIAGEHWHSDVSCDPQPPLGTILQMLEVPPAGGDTLFANMVAAFEALPAPLQRSLEGLTAVHDGEHHYRGRYDGNNDEAKTYPRSEHPVVRTHPVSGRSALFVNRIFTRRIVELEEQESAALLEKLLDHVELPEFQCRFQWEVGSVAFWDNRCAQHQALWDYFPHRRRGWRVTIRGEAPFYRA